MTVQVFRGRTLKEAQRAAVQLLGSDAVVITTRTVPKPGVSGWLGGSEVEIAAMSPARDDDAVRRASGSAVRFAPGVYSTASIGAGTTELTALRAELKGDMRAIKTMIAKGDDSSFLANELSGLRELIEHMGYTAPRGDKTSARLRGLGIEGPAATALSRALKGKGVDADAVRDALSQFVKATAWPVDAQRALVALVGPSGAGKTTTAAKLAARASVEGRSVMLVGCDTFRVGATEQLSRYASLMQAEFATARTAEGLGAILDRARADMVVVDTSGRVPAPEGVEAALAASSRRAVARTRHVLLCTPASIRSIDAARVAKRYGVLAPTSLVITKLDETESPAGLLHASWATKLAVSVLCFGQRVPEDVGPATMGALLDYLAPKRDAKRDAKRDGSAAKA